MVWSLLSAITLALFWLALVFFATTTVYVFLSGGVGVKGIVGAIVNLGIGLVVIGVLFALAKWFDRKAKEAQ